MTVYRSGFDSGPSFSSNPVVELWTIFVFVIGGLMVLLILCRCCISPPTRGLLAPYREPTNSPTPPMPPTRVVGRRIQLATVTGTAIPTGASPRRRIPPECTPSDPYPTEERAPYTVSSESYPPGRTPIPPGETSNTPGWAPHITVGAPYPTVGVSSYNAMSLPTAAPNATDIDEVPPPSYEEVMGMH